MIEQPEFAGHIHVEVLSPDLVVMASDGESRALPGRLYPLLVPLIDGKNTVGDIIDGVAGKANALDVRAGLSWLEEDGLIRDARSEPPTAPRLDPLLDPALPPDARRSLSVTVSVLGTFSQDAIRESLSRHGIAFDRRSTRSDLGILLVDDYLREDIALFNRHALETGMTWMIARPVPPVPWIGPVFRPGETACWNCLALRLRENRPINAYVAETRRRRGAMPHGNGPTSKTATAQALDILASRVARWSAGLESQSLEAGLLAPDAAGRRFHRHVVTRMPHCAACNVPPRDRRPTAIRLPDLDRRQVVAKRDGGYRTASAEETVRRLRPLVSPLTGAIGFVERRGSDDVQMVVADHPFRFDRVPRHALRTGGRHKSAGKGLGVEQAEASAMCEALERYSGMFRGDEIRRTARFADLGAEAVHPDRCLNYSDRQYAERDRWNGLGSQKLWIPERFDDDREVEWSPAWSMTHDAPRWLPTAYCYYGYPQDATHALCPVDSNGNAAGNTVEEAILQGFLELVERDAVAVWWYDRSPRPGVALTSFPDAALARTVAAYTALGRNVSVLDITHDFGIPVFVALSRSVEGPEELLIGFGAHFDADIAIARAVTEMGQFLPAARRGRWRPPFTAPVSDDRFMRPVDPPAHRTRADYARPDFASLAACVERCVETAAGLGLETLVIDQTRADVGLPVVKVVVPDLRHFTARLGPGRLYEVPVRLGLRTTALLEDDLNPSHIVI